MATITLTVNGKSVTAAVDSRTLLVQFLRENLRLTGTHVGCDTSQCGACVVHVDGQAVKSCTMLAVSCDGSQRHHDRGPRQRHRAAPDAGGLPRASRPAVRLLHAGHDHDGGRHREPQGLRRSTSTTIREELEGNICRCTGYHNIVKAVEAGAQAMGAAGHKIAAE